MVSTTERRVLRAEVHLNMLEEVMILKESEEVKENNVIGQTAQRVQLCKKEVAD